MTARRYRIVVELDDGRIHVSRPRTHAQATALWGWYETTGLADRADVTVTILTADQATRLGYDLYAPDRDPAAELVTTPTLQAVA